MFLGLAVGFLTALISWQINLISIHRGLQGSKTAFFIGLGSTIADALLITAALTGTAYAVEGNYIWEPLKWLGIITIFFVSIKALLTHPRNPVQDSEKHSPAKDFLLGFILVIMNPANILLWIGMTSFILTHFPNTEYHRLAFVIEFVLSSALWFLALSFLLIPAIRKWHFTHIEWISKISALFLLITAIVLIFRKF